MLLGFCPSFGHRTSENPLVAEIPHRVDNADQVLGVLPESTINPNEFTEVNFAPALYSPDIVRHNLT